MLKVKRIASMYVILKCGIKSKKLPKVIFMREIKRPLIVHLNKDLKAFIYGLDVASELSLMYYCETGGGRFTSLKAHVKMSSVQRADHKIFIAQGEWFVGPSPQPLREEKPLKVAAC
jgi:hypothetical protein